MMVAIRCHWLAFPSAWVLPKCSLPISSLIGSLFFTRLVIQSEVDLSDSEIASKIPKTPSPPNSEFSTVTNREFLLTIFS